MASSNMSMHEEILRRVQLVRRYATDDGVLWPGPFSLAQQELILEAALGSQLADTLSTLRTHEQSLALLSEDDGEPDELGQIARLLSRRVAMVRGPALLPYPQPRGTVGQSMHLAMIHESTPTSAERRFFGTQRAEFGRALLAAIDQQLPAATEGSANQWLLSDWAKRNNDLHNVSPLTQLAKTPKASPAPHRVIVFHSPICCLAFGDNLMSC